jgi:hypothetical protein
MLAPCDLGKKQNSGDNGAEARPPFKELRKYFTPAPPALLTAL